MITLWEDAIVDSSLLLLLAVAEGGAPKLAFTGVSEEVPDVRLAVEEGDVITAPTAGLSSSFCPVFVRAGREGDIPTV